MTPPDDLADVTLIDEIGRVVARCRVPRKPRVPPVLQWGNRFFRALYVNSQYIETGCYLVPVENMYGNPAPAAPAPEGKKK